MLGMPIQWVRVMRCICDVFPSRCVRPANGMGKLVANKSVAKGLYFNRETSRPNPERENRPQPIGLEVSLFQYTPIFLTLKNP